MFLTACLLAATTANKTARTSWRWGSPASSISYTCVAHALEGQHPQLPAPAEADGAQQCCTRGVAPSPHPAPPLYKPPGRPHLVASSWWSMNSVRWDLRALSLVSRKRSRHILRVLCGRTGGPQAGL